MTRAQTSSNTSYAFFSSLPFAYIPPTHCRAHHASFKHFLWIISWWICSPLSIPCAFTTFDIHIHQSFAAFPSLNTSNNQNSPQLHIAELNMSIGEDLISNQQWFALVWESQTQVFLHQTIKLF